MELSEAELREIYAEQAERSGDIFALAKAASIRGGYRDGDPEFRAMAEVSRRSYAAGVAAGMERAAKAKLPLDTLDYRKNPTTATVAYDDGFLAGVQCLRAAIRSLSPSSPSDDTPEREDAHG